MASVEGLRVIVAGAATGVGAGTAKLLAARGAKVVVADINISAAKQVGEEITAAGGSALVVEFDLSDEESIKNLVAQGTEWLGAYAASKAAVHALTRHTAATYGPDNVRCNTVALGPILTAALERGIAASPAMQEGLKRVPLRRLGKLEEVGALLAFMISPDAAYITGDIWSINGGTHVMTY
ncbi:hypothetical protein COL5a_002566 [Colletotrichum fioriniae]|nr:hypothetical protein COL5a_002566 [Colletotrichum fioriniae]